VCCVRATAGSCVQGGGDLLDYVVNKEVFAVGDDGHLGLPMGTGLGVVIDEAKVRAAAVRGHAWRDREWELSDGTPTTW
jgi:galactonate dehydratase